jgi:hypothetical protein
VVVAKDGSATNKHMAAADPGILGKAEVRAHEAAILTQCNATVIPIIDMAAFSITLSARVTTTMREARYSRSIGKPVPFLHLTAGRTGLYRTYLEVSPIGARKLGCVDARHLPDRNLGRTS